MSESKEERKERAFNNMIEMEEAIKKLQEADKENKELIKALKEKIEKMKATSGIDITEEEEDFFDANRDE